MSRGKAKKAIRFWEQWLDVPALSKGASEQIKRLKDKHKKQVQKSQRKER